MIFLDNGCKLIGRQLELKLGSFLYSRVAPWLPFQTLKENWIEELDQIHLRKHLFHYKTIISKNMRN